MMVSENQERNEDEEEEEDEVLDDPDQERPVRRPKIKSGSKKNSRNNSKGKDNLQTSEKSVPAGGLTKDNFDEFFNQIASSAAASQNQQQPSKSKTTVGISPQSNNKGSVQAQGIKKETLPPKPTSTISNSNQSISKKSTKTQAQKALPSQQTKKVFEIEELEERIRAYQGILQDNEATIEKFRDRVKQLETQMGQFQHKENQEQHSVDELRDRHQKEEKVLLQALDSERVKSRDYQVKIQQLEDSNQQYHQSSVQFRQDYNMKVQEIQNKLENLVQAQLQQKPPPSNGGGGKGKKGKQNQQNQQNQDQQHQANKENLVQLQSTLDQIKDLLTPLDLSSTIPQQDDEILTRLIENNTFLKKLNLTLSDKMLQLEQTYQTKFTTALNGIATEKEAWLRESSQILETQLSQMKQHYEEEIEKIKAQHNEIIDSHIGTETELRESIIKVEGEHKSQVEKLQQDLEKTTGEIKSLKSEAESAKTKADQANTRADEAQNKAAEKTKSELEKAKRDSLESLQQRLQVCLFQTFDLDMKLGGASIEDTLTQFSATVKEHFKSSAQQLDEQNLKALKETWEAAAERFKQMSLARFGKQSQKDSQQWLSTRLPSGQQTGQKKGQPFKDSELAKFFGQQLELVFSVNAYLQDVQIQLNESNQKKESINVQLTKLQKDLRDSAQREKDLQKVKDTHDTLNNDHKSLKSQLQDVLQDKIGCKLKLEEQREKLEMLVKENADLKDKVGELENEVKRLKKQTKQLQAQLDKQEDYRQQSEKLSQDLKYVESQLKSKESEQDEQRKTVSNLQRAIQQHQDEYDQLVRLKERESLEDKQLISTLQIQAEQMKERVRETAQLQEKTQALESELLQHQTQLEKSELERKEVSKYAQELLEKFKKEQENQEYQVDRRIINKFLVNYLNQQSSKEVKMQMLEAMSKILAFSIEEKQLLGLVKKQSLLDGEGETQQSSKGLGEKLINFFLMDDDDD